MHLTAPSVTITHVVRPVVITSVTPESGTPDSVATTSEVRESVVVSVPNCPYLLPPQHLRLVLTIAQPPVVMGLEAEENIPVTISAATPSSGN
jgi:hypothetical protein